MEVLKMGNLSKIRESTVGRALLKVGHFAREVCVAIQSKTLLASIRWSLFRQ
jgi:hypothetical protein